MAVCIRIGFSLLFFSASACTHLDELDGQGLGRLEYELKENSSAGFANGRSTKKVKLAKKSRPDLKGLTGVLTLPTAGLPSGALKDDVQEHNARAEELLLDDVGDQNDDGLQDKNDLLWAKHCGIAAHALADADDDGRITFADCLATIKPGHSLKSAWLKNIFQTPKTTPQRSENVHIETQIASFEGLELPALNLDVVPKKIIFEREGVETPGLPSKHGD
ncbi:MAG: hypothetical protein QGI45_00715 [Myxococcota bacterium]|jgi:hypothetical protein|nr:hypothetical protein [Myxococcota bacterium]